MAKEGHGRTGGSYFDHAMPLLYLRSSTRPIRIWEMISMSFDYLTVGQAAETIGVTVGRVHQLIRADRLKAFRPDENGRTVLVSRKDAERLAKKPEKTGRPRSGRS